MGIPTLEVGYTSAMPRREDHEVHKDMWGHLGEGGKKKYSTWNHKMTTFFSCYNLHNCSKSYVGTFDDIDVN